MKMVHAILAGRIARLAMAALVLALLWTLVDGRAALARLRSADPVWLVLAMLAVNAQTILSAVRWRLVAEAVGIRLATRVAVREYYVAQIVNQTLPGGVAGDVARAVRSGSAGHRMDAAQAVVIERMAGQVALASVAILGAGTWLFTNEAGPGGDPVRTAVLVIATTVAGIVLGGWMLAHLSVAARGFILAAANALVKQGRWRGQLALAIAIVLLNLASFDFAARATGTEMAAAQVIVIVPLVLFAMVLPFTVAGWGFREGAAVALFPLAGASGDAGLAASVAFGLVLLAASVPGAFWLWRAPRQPDRDDGLAVGSPLPAKPAALRSPDHDGKTSNAT